MSTTFQCLRHSEAAGCRNIADGIQEIINGQEDAGRILVDKQIVSVGSEVFIYMWFSDQVTPTINL